MDLEVEHVPRQSLVSRPLRAVMRPFVTRALSAVFDSSAIGAEVLLDLSPAQGAMPGSVGLQHGVVVRTTERGTDVTVRLGPDGVDLVAVARPDAGGGHGPGGGVGTGDDQGTGVAGSAPGLGGVGRAAARRRAARHAGRYGR